MIVPPFDADVYIPPCAALSDAEQFSTSISVIKYFVAWFIYPTAVDVRGLIVIA